MRPIENAAPRSSKAGPWLWWVLTGVLAMITAAALVVTQIFVLVKYGASCHDPAPLSSRGAGETWLIVTASIATALWLLGAWFGIRLGQKFAFMLGCTVIATAPGWLYVIYGLTPAHWSDGFCF